MNHSPCYLNTFLLEYPDGLAAFDLERGQGRFLRRQINDVAIRENILHSYRALSIVSYRCQETINSTWRLVYQKTSPASRLSPCLLSRARMVTSHKFIYKAQYSRSRFGCIDASDDPKNGESTLYTEKTNILKGSQPDHDVDSRITFILDHSPAPWQHVDVWILLKLGMGSVPLFYQDLCC